MGALSYKSFLKNKILSCVVVPALLLALAAVTGTVSARPQIVGPKIYGVRPNTAFLFPLGAINTGGSRTFHVISGLPAGLSLDTTKGFVTGTAPAKGRYLFKFKVKCATGEDTATLDIRSGDTLCYVPPMGWNSWNFWNSCVSQAVILETAEFIAKSGLRDLGFHYVNIDDAWSQDNSKRLPNGDIAVRSTFSMGIQAIADSVHKLGLKLGLYSDIGTGTFCGGAGSGGYYKRDAQMFARWGVDYLKVDKAGGGSNETTIKGLYKEFGTELKNSGRSIVFSVCEWGRLRPWLWARDAHASLWRTTWDSRDYWYSKNYINVECGVVNGFDTSNANDTLWKFSGPGGWNDMDMMWVCTRREMNSSTNQPKLYPGCDLKKKEGRSIMSLWCLCASPLILGNDFTRRWGAPDPDTLMEILTNEEVVAINQDVLGKQARIIWRSSNKNEEILSRPLEDGSYAVGLLNRSLTTQTSATVTVNWSQLGITGEYTVRDVWERQNKGTFTSSYSCTVEPREVKVLRIFKDPGTSTGHVSSAGNDPVAFVVQKAQNSRSITITCRGLFNTVELIDLLGRTIVRKNGSGSTAVSIPGGMVPSGVYMIKVVDASNRAGIKKIIHGQY